MKHGHILERHGGGPAYLGTAPYESCNRCGGCVGTSLPTECPGTPMTGHVLQAVTQGVMDFQAGEWKSCMPKDSL